MNSSSKAMEDGQSYNDWGWGDYPDPPCYGLHLTPEEEKLLLEHRRKVAADKEAVVQKGRRFGLSYLRWLYSNREENPPSF